MILLYLKIRVLDDWMVHGLIQSWTVIWTELELQRTDDIFQVEYFSDLLFFHVVITQVMIHSDIDDGLAMMLETGLLDTWISIWT